MIDPIDFLRVTGVGMDWIMCLPLYKCLQPGDCDMPYWHIRHILYP